MPTSPDLVHYTITGAQDWPMFKEMFAGMRILVGGAWLSTVGLLIYIYRSIIARIASERKDDKEGCAKCNGAHIREFSDVWDAIDCCCPRGTTKEKVAEARKRLAVDGGTP